MEIQQHESIFLIRHAQSQYNLAQLKARNSDVESKTEENLDVKYDINLLDCNISDKGTEETLQAKEQMKNKEVALVFTSPLRRCMQTTYNIFAEHKDSPRIVVWPLLKERLHSGCDIADNLDLLKKEFPTFDFTLVDEMKKPHFWHLEMLDKELKEEFLKSIESKQFKDDEEIKKNHSKIMVEKMKTDHPRCFESLNNLNERTKQAKSQLQDMIKRFQKKNGCVVMVTHSRFLESWTAGSFNEDGTPNDCKWFKNCEIGESKL